MPTSRELIDRCATLTGKTAAEIIAAAVRNRGFTNPDDVFDQNLFRWREHQYLPDYVGGYCEREIERVTAR